ncbi:MAG TPA: acyltransferase [Puia sp.]|nr:acyltransferase [Puia sp.]
MSNPKTSHIPQLDGLRGIAILLVISYHYFNSFKIFSFGWSGVDLFFVLSGFLITGKLLSSVNHQGYFINFYRNRILRIFPLYYTVLIIFYVGVLFFVRQEHLTNVAFYKGHWKSFFLFMQNWTFLNDGFPKDKYLLHFWSLALEEQFYLVWPFIIYFLANRKIFSMVLIILVLTALALRCLFFFSNPSSSTQQYFSLNTFCRMDSFVAGALVCYLYYSKIKINSIVVNLAIAFSIAGIVSSIYIWKSASFYENPFLQTLGFSLIAFFYAGILYKLLQPEETMLIKILSAKWLIFFGKISYGLYIFHWLVSITLYHVINNWGTLHLTNNHLIMNIISTIACIILSIGISVISFYYFESYFLSLKKKIDAIE